MKDTESTTNWEERFDKLFDDTDGDLYYDEGPYLLGEIDPNAIKSFIRTLLAKEIQLARIEELAWVLGKYAWAPTNHIGRTREEIKARLAELEK